MLPAEEERAAKEEDPLHFVRDVLEGVDEEDRAQVTDFARFLEDAVGESGLTDAFRLPTLVERFGVHDLSTLNKEGACLQALWVIYLRIMRKSLGDDSRFKYKNMPDFLAEYNGELNGLDVAEQVKLFHSANWMHILFSMVPAKKNKGLAVHVIPKLVEGFSVKYITGSGQTKGTADRVKIFEHEGNVKPFQRGKWKNSEEGGEEGGQPRESVGKKAKKPRQTREEKERGKEEKEREKALESVPKKVKLEPHKSESSISGILDLFAKDKPIETVDFTECLHLMRSNSHSLHRPVGEAVEVSSMERHKSIDSVDFAECLKLLRTNSYGRPPELNRDWSNSSIGFLTDSLLLGGDGGFSLDRCDGADGLVLLNEAAHASTQPVSGIDYSLLGADSELDLNLSSYNQLASVSNPAKRSTSHSATWRANNATDEVAVAAVQKPL